MNGKLTPTGGGLPVKKAPERPTVRAHAVAQLKAPQPPAQQRQTVEPDRLHAHEPDLFPAADLTDAHRDALAAFRFQPEPRRGKLPLRRWFAFLSY